MAGRSPPDRPSGPWVILVVDDDEPARMVLAKILEEAGHTAIQAATAEGALEILSYPRQAGVSKIDLVITNTMLPRIPGTELARRVQEIRPGLPVLHVTGHPEAFPPERTRRETDRHVLRKPFTPDVLVHVVNDLLQGDRLDR